MAPSLRAISAAAGFQTPDDLCQYPCSGPCRVDATREELRRLRLLPEISAVVLTVNGGSDSYDKLFTEVKQKGPEGKAVAVYEANYEALGAIAAALQGDQSQGGIYAELAQDVGSLADPASFVANLECCGCCSESGFGARPEAKSGLWQLVEACLSRGSFVMASDFSLKAIIKEWKQEHLGPLPFVQLPGGCNTSFDLGFDSADLITAPSAQLNVVGQLCADGKAASRAMGGTIVYAIDKVGAEAAGAAGVTLQVLTVVEKVDGMNTSTDPRFKHHLCTAGGSCGVAGHVLLTYPSGGRLLTSMGHWIELTKLHGCTEESVLQAAERRGAAYSRAIREELDSCATQSERDRALQRCGAQLVQNAAPCMVRNSAGGLSYEVDDSTKLLRYLILGSEGTYYVQPKEHTAANLTALLRMLKAGKGEEAVSIIKAVSTEGRAARQTPTLLALAMCCQLGDQATKTAAYAALPVVCRIPTHLMEFLDKSEAVAKTKEGGGSTGWGRAHRRAISCWYNEFRTSNAKALAEAVTKYQKRQGWSHLDALRLCHVRPSTSAHAVVFRYIAKGITAAAEAVELTVPATPPRDSQPPAETAGTKKRVLEDCPAASASSVLEYLNAVEEIKALSPTKDALDSADATVDRCTELIETHNLVREHVPTHLLGSKKVWKSLLKRMPMTALLRSLAKITALGVLDDVSAVHSIVKRLTDPDAVAKARLHPLSVLTAHRTYSSGQGDKGSLTWTPNAEICTALEKTFTLAFATVRPAGKRFLLAIDISESMSAPISGGGGATLSCAEAAAVMALIIAKTEPSCTVMAFAETFVPMPISPEMSLEQVLGAAEKLRLTVQPAGTDCSVPMQWALREHLLPQQVAGPTSYDCFVVFTDNETWSGEMQPADALRRYRDASGVADARLVTVGLASNDFSIADPEDTGMLDVVGFDTSAPDVIANFAAGRI